MMLPRVMEMMMMTQLLLKLNHVVGYENAEMSLRRALLDGYDPLVRPVHNISEKLNVSVVLDLENIDFLDEKKQILHQTVWALMRWHDEFLHWDPDDYEQIPFIALPHNMVWTPDVFFTNGFDSFYDEEPSPYNKIRLYATGDVLRSDHGVLMSRCWVHVSYFPFDTQECDIMLELFSLFSDQTFFGDVRFVLDRYRSHGPWKLISHHVTIYDDAGYDEGPFGGATITFKIAREPLVYVIFLLIPMLALTFLGHLTFCLPAESGEKVALSITVILSFTVFQSMLFDTAPDASSDMPYIAIYNTCVMITTVISLAATILVLQWHHSTDPIPEALQRHLRCMSKLAGKSGDEMCWPDAAKILDRILLGILITINLVVIICTIWIYVTQ